MQNQLGTDFRSGFAPEVNQKINYILVVGNETHTASGIFPTDRAGCARFVIGHLHRYHITFILFFYVFSSIFIETRIILTAFIFRFRS